MKLFEAAKSVSIADVYEYLTGKKVRGFGKKKSIAVRCPLPNHDDRSPSFNLYPNNTWYCFGCKAGGSSVDLVMKMKGVDNVSAAKMICDRFGVQYEDRQPRKTDQPQDQPESHDEAKTIIATNARLRALFAMSLPSAPDPDYFAKRGIGELVEEYGLGFCPERPLFKKEHIERAMALGLCDSIGRSIFHGRYMLPIDNGAGQTIGFIGRATPEAEAAGEPKYLISPNSAAFHKRGAFFNSKGLYAEGDRVYVVEGAFDALALIASGIKGVVASLGSSLSDPHIRAFEKIVHKDVVLCFDDDMAGQLARDKAMGYCRTIRLRVMTGDMAGCKDASELLIKKGQDAVREAFSQSMPAPQFAIASAVSKGDLKGNLPSQEALWGVLARMLGSKNPNYAAKYPINPAYTPVAFNFYWKEFRDAIQ